MNGRGTAALARSTGRRGGRWRGQSSVRPWCEGAPVVPVKERERGHREREIEGKTGGEEVAGSPWLLLLLAGGMLERSSGEVVQGIGAQARERLGGGAGGLRRGRGGWGSNREELESDGWLVAEIEEDLWSGSGGEGWMGQEA